MGTCRAQGLGMLLLVMETRVESSMELAMETVPDQCLTGFRI